MTGPILEETAIRLEASLLLSPVTMCHSAAAHRCGGRASSWGCPGSINTHCFEEGAARVINGTSRFHQSLVCFPCLTSEVIKRVFVLRTGGPGWRVFLQLFVDLSAYSHCCCFHWDSSTCLCHLSRCLSVALDFSKYFNVLL